MLTVQVLHSKALKNKWKLPPCQHSVKSDNKKHNSKFEWSTNGSALEILSNAIANLIEIRVKNIEKRIERKSCDPSKSP